MINRVVLVGRLTRDPELKYTQNNTANTRFRLAVNRSFKDQNGNQQADFINCVAWRTQAENMARFLKKGSLIGVEGRIETGSYQAQDGQMRYTTDVIVDSVQFLEPRGTQPGGEQPRFSGNDHFNQFSDNAQPSKPFLSGNSGMDTNSFPTHTGNNNSAPDFNSTIDVSDDDLSF